MSKDSSNEEITWDCKYMLVGSIMYGILNSCMFSHKYHNIKRHTKSFHYEEDNL